MIGSIMDVFIFAESDIALWTPGWNINEGSSELGQVTFKITPPAEQRRRAINFNAGLAEDHVTLRYTKYSYCVCRVGGFRKQSFSC